MATRHPWIAGIILFLAAVSVTANDAQMNRDIAVLYVQAAAESFHAGEADHAAAMVDLALEYDPSFSDAHYIRGRMSSAHQRATAEAVASYQRALVLDSWNRYGAVEASVGLASIYNRTGDFQSAAELLGSVSFGDPLLPDSLLSQAWYQEALAQRGLGRIDLAGERVARARDRFPDDPRFFLLQLRQEPVPGIVYKDELQRLMRAVGPDDPGLLEALLLYALQAPTRGEAQWAADRYRSGGGAHPAVVLATARFGDRPDTQEFLRLGGIAHRNEWVQAARALGELPQDLLSAARDFTGVSVVDADRDGFWEERLTVTGGMVTRWEVDRNQDGIDEIDIHLAGSVPQRLLLGPPASGGQEVVIEYNRYPFVASVRIPADGAGQLLTVRPGAFRYQVFRPLPEGGVLFPGPAALVPSLPVLDLPAVRRAMIRRDDLDAAGRAVEQRFFEQGVAIKAIRDSDGDGLWDHLLVLDNGAAVAGVRDIDSDGYFEVAEGYVNGRLVLLAVDENDNGSPEVVERNEDTDIREWDLDEDGFIDVREFGIWTSDVRREFLFLERQRQ